MKAYIDVRNRKEAKLLRRGLREKDIRALVLIIGALDVLPDHDMKVAVFDAATDILQVKAAIEAKAKGQLPV